MIIRSQSKKILINLDNISHIRIIENKNNLFEIFVYAYNSQWIGDYSTKEKAIKVLDMIQDAYCKMKSSDCIFCGSSIDLCKASQEKIDNFIETNRKLYVFDMPQDSEV